MIGNIAREKCTGCKMCADVCAREAIRYESDNKGFWYPIVDNNRCNECGACIKLCPAFSHKVFKKNIMPEVYAAWSIDENVRITSTSGGAFWVIAKEFMDNGGVVVGCRYSPDWKSAEHVIAYNEEDLLKIKGSKYFQSDTSGVYKQVKEELETGKSILFCGTPCQTSALYSFLGQDYNNLYYMDFICRSVNSPLAFKSYIEELEKEYGAEVVEVHLKNKKYGWHSLASKVRFSNGKETIRDKDKDWWVKGFLSNDLYTRLSCFNCQYRELPRVSADITIGDFWEIKNQSNEDMFNGISVVLLNSEKGKELFNRTKQHFVVQKHSLEEVLPGNPALVENPRRSKKQDKFFSLLENRSFSFCVQSCLKKSMITKCKDIVLGLIKKIRGGVKRIIALSLDGRISIMKYIYFNYCCKNIVRKDGSKVIPYKGAILDMNKTARIYLSGRNLEIGYNKLKRSKSETHIRLNNNAVWNCKNGALMFYNTVLEIKENAVLDTGFFSANGGSTIIADKHIVFGEDVMIGRNVIVYDSDFHQLLNQEGIITNPPETVTIEDHVWLTSNITVLKGVTIGAGSLVSAQTVIHKNVPKGSVIAGKASGNVISEHVRWSRERCVHE